MARIDDDVYVQEELTARPLTLYGVEGHLLRRNDAVFQPALPTSARSSGRAHPRTLVFFGGDIQNLSHLMDPTEPDSPIDYQEWCLEETALRLSSDFPSCHIVVIKPSRVVFEHISCFDNFVESNMIGIPKYYYHYVALLHLEKLLKTISKTLREMDPDNLFKMLLRTLHEEELQEEYKIENATSWQYNNISADKKRLLLNWQKNLRLHQYPLTLVAFSKGCVVLNQFLYEFHYVKGLEPNLVDSSFIDRIRDIYWLDSGNCGQRNVYVTSTGILRTLSALDVIVHVHASIYMTEDENRPWIKEQYVGFVLGIAALGGNVIYFQHFSSNDDLRSHFMVLQEFQSTEKKHFDHINSPNVRLKRKQPVMEEPVQVAPVRRRRRPPPPPDEGETIGYCLYNPQVSPYLALQIAKRNTGYTPEAHHIRLSCPQYSNLEQLVPTTYSLSLSSRQTPSTCAEPSTPAQTSATTVQKPTPSMVVWSTDMLDKNHDLLKPAVLLNDQRFTFSEEEAVKYKETYYSENLTTMIGIPNQRNPLRVHMFSEFKETYVPAVNSHYFVVNKKNEKQEGEDLPDFFADEETSESHAEVSSAEMSSPESGLESSASESELEASESELDTSSAESDSDPDSGDDADVSNQDSTDETSAYDAEDVGSSSGTSSPVNRRIGSRSGVGITLSTTSLIDGDGLGSRSTSVTQQEPNTVADPPALSQHATPRRAQIAQSNVSQNVVDTPRDPINSQSTSGLGSSSTSVTQEEPNTVADPPALSQHATPRRAQIAQSNVSQNVVDTPRDTIYSQTTSGLGSSSTSVTQEEPNTVADPPALSQRATPRRAQIAQSNVSQNLVDTPRDPINSQSTSGLVSRSTSVTQQEPNTVADPPVLSQHDIPRRAHITEATLGLQIQVQTTSPGPQVTSSSQDAVAPRAHTSGARVRARDVDDEPPCRYNLRKRIKRCYNEDILHIQYQ